MRQAHQQFRVYCDFHKDYEKDQIMIDQFKQEFESGRHIIGKDHTFEFCTGREDSTGKLIWQGDKVLVTCLSNFKTWETEVVWCEKKCAYVCRYSEEFDKKRRTHKLDWRFDDTDFKTIPFRMTIIGNIH